jgi:hypothetical protein
MMSRTALKYLIAVLLAAFAFAAFGCMAGYRTTTKNGHESVYRVDEDGTKTLVYEKDKDGTLTIHDETDPRAQRMMEAQAAMEQSQAADAARIERIKAAPKRPSGEPIYVALYDIELGPKLKEAQHSDGAVMAEVVKNFESDDVINLVSASELKSRQWVEMAKMSQGKSSKEAPPADVNVVSKAYLKEVYGISKSTGKPASAWYVVFEAVVSCNYLPAEYTVTDEGNMFQNAQVTKRFVDKVKTVIKTNIGPTLPADRSL